MMPLTQAQPCIGGLGLTQIQPSISDNNNKIEIV